MTDLSIIIPSRNEIFLKNTIDDLLANAESDIEIIVVLDGQWSNVPLDQNPRLTIIYHNQSVGQRAAINEAAKLANSKYIMKCDAHCAFDKGFDVKLLADMQDNWTMIPLMKNLHAFDWVCPNGHRRYQGPSGPCHICHEPTTMDVVWIAKDSPKSTSYRFDNTLHFQYWNEYAKRPEAQGELSDTMSIQGSCFLVTKAKFFELELCDENHGSWGQQGVEVACKTWLSGGRVVCNKKTWYAHMFRTQGGDFGFPYPNPGISKARSYSRDLFLNNKWEKAIHPLSWLIDKFAPVPDWEKSWGVVYYTHNKLDPEIMEKCQRQLKRCIGTHRLVSVSNTPIDFGENIVLDIPEGPLNMFKHILAGLKELNTDYVFLAEHDVVYSPSHFYFVPTKKDVFYFNTNVWRIRYPDGHGVWADNTQQLSGLVAYRELLIDFVTQKIKQIEEKGFDRHYEPSPRQTICQEYSQENFQSERPNLDIRHESTQTKSKWSIDDFRNKEFASGWKEADNIPGWGHMWHWWKRL